MPSRKRNKGKDRKAKKAAEVNSKWQRWARGEDSLGRKVIQCNHGRDLVIPDEDNHPVVSFMNSFSILWDDKVRMDGPIKLMYENLQDSFQTHREVWDNNIYRELAINMFTTIGTNMILADNANQSINSISKPISIVDYITILENYVPGARDFQSAVNTRGAADKMRNIMDVASSIGRRDVLKFFRKRLDCKCLKAMHLDARKTIPKLGKCFHCKKVVQRASLMVCSKCRMIQYCSRECQVANWPMHACLCQDFVRAHEQQSKNKAAKHRESAAMHTGADNSSFDNDKDVDASKPLDVKVQEIILTKEDDDFQHETKCKIDNVENIEEEVLEGKNNKMEAMCDMHKCSICNIQ